MTLSARQVRFLRGLGHKLHPVVTVADRGLTPNVIKELEGALDKHELIKVRIRADRTTRKNWLNEIEARCAAEPSLRSPASAGGTGRSRRHAGSTSAIGSPPRATQAAP